MNSKKILFILIVAGLFYSCKEDVLPKPKAMLRLEYPKASTESLNSDCNFQFQYNKEAGIKLNKDCAVIIDYPTMKGAIYITYKPVKENLRALLIDAQKFSYEHAIKADNILEQPFLNKDNKVYGMFYEVKGNAASQAQFYVTDSINHFVTGSLYFTAKPNYDSILPAAVYLQKDIRKIMETLRWKY